MALLFRSSGQRARIWHHVFAEHRPDCPLLTQITPETAPSVRYLVAWMPEPDIIAALPNLKVIFSIGAGIDQFGPGEVPEGVTLVRMIEPGLTRSVVNYAVMAVLMLQRDMPAYRAQQQAGQWLAHPVRDPEATRVGIMGLGVLGQASGAALTALGFPVSGWARSTRQIAGITTYAGQEQLPEFLAESDICVCLLPLTATTRGILSRAVLDRLPRGAGLVHLGRGGHLAAADLIAALDDGQLSGAVLDVTDPEPLPAHDPLWHDPRIIVTPHIAGQTRAESSAMATLDNIALHERGLAMIGVVSQAAGY
ncbi:2-hydroxyacid dehydrogenase [Pelagibacterium sp.]|uniref:2-hydroxyacid dehydrogenase n=1 Tax=Pelagibacterium sp. TaxID=1967288 RepID=UPI003BA8C47B